MAEEVVLDLVANDKASKVVKGTSKEIKGATTEATLMSGAMNTVRGAMVKVKATGRLMFGSIKAGLISTGIGAFVVVIGSLVAYFTQTKKGAELLEQAFAGIGAAISVLTDRISKIGGAIAKVFSGDFKGAAEDVKGALSGIADEIVSEVDAAIRLKGELQDITDATRGFNIEKAKTNQEIAKALLLAEDEHASNEVRLQALKDALALEEETTEKELELQRRRVAAVEEEVGLGESLEEDLQRLNDEKIRLIELETASIKQRKKVVTQVNEFEKSINAEAVAQEKERTDAKIESDKILNEAEAVKQAKKIEDDKAESDRLAKVEEDRQTSINTIRDSFKIVRDESKIQALEREQEETIAELERLEASEQAKADVIKFFDDKITEQKSINATKEADQNRAIQNINLGIAAKGFGDISNLLKEGSAASKTAAIAQIGINTALGYMQGLDIAQKSAAGTGPAAAFTMPLFYASQVLSVLGAANKARQIIGGGGSTPSAPSIGGGSVGGNIAASIPASTNLDDVVGSINNQAEQPLQAYVISQEVTDSQEAQAYINNQRTL